MARVGIDEPKRSWRNPGRTPPAGLQLAQLANKDGRWSRGEPARMPLPAISA